MRHPYAQPSEERGEDDDNDSVFAQARPESAYSKPAPGVEADCQTIVSTSESCYSTESYHDPADEMYRRSRTESLVLPKSDANRLSVATSQTLRDSVTLTGLPSPSSRQFPCPPDIRVETASTICTTPTMAARELSGSGSIINEDLLFATPSRDAIWREKQRFQAQIGVGRQTIDPRSLGEPAEWTLLLGEDEETSFERARKASLMGVGAAKVAAAAGARARLKSGVKTKDKERARKKSAARPGSSGKTKADTEDEHMPFSAAEPPMIDIEDTDASDDVRLSRKDRERVLHRSGSAQPVLDGDRKPKPGATKDQANTDWTLMLPLPFPSKRGKAGPSALAVPPFPKTPERKRVLHKARSSVDLTTPVAHVRTRKVSTPLALKKKAPKPAVVEEQEQEQKQSQPSHKKELSAEEMLAAIFDSNDTSSPVHDGEPGNDSEADREEHRKRALDMLSGNPAQARSRSPSPPLASKSESPSQSTQEDNTTSSLHPGTVGHESRSPSPTPSTQRFEEHLTKLLDQSGKDEDTDSEGAEIVKAKVENVSQVSLFSPSTLLTSACPHPTSLRPRQLHHPAILASPILRLLQPPLRLWCLSLRRLRGPLAT